MGRGIPQSYQDFADYTDLRMAGWRLLVLLSVWRTQYMWPLWALVAHHDRTETEPNTSSFNPRNRCNPVPPRNPREIR